MATDQERLIVAVEARVTELERGMRRASEIVGREGTQMERRARQTSQRIEASMKGASDRIGQSFRNMSAGLFAGVGIGKAKDLLDTAARIDNALKITGLSGDKLNAVYDRLFQSAQRNAAPLETLTTSTAGLHRHRIRLA